MHQKVLKRGWHTEDQLGNIAWLCRACHSFVHRVATNEELARDWYTVERLEEREDVIAFANWIGGVRWKAR
jgi:DNA polymerase sigma